MKGTVLFLKSNKQRSKDLQKDTLIQHRALTWNCTLSHLMRIQRDAIQLKALYL